ncbi:hypothetical protein ACLOJK_038268 [Asimina triloba]
MAAKPITAGDSPITPTPLLPGPAAPISTGRQLHHAQTGEANEPASSSDNSGHGSFPRATPSSDASLQDPAMSGTNRRPQQQLQLHLRIKSGPSKQWTLDRDSAPSATEAATHPSQHHRPPLPADPWQTASPNPAMANRRTHHRRPPRLLCPSTDPSPIISGR